MLQSQTYSGSLFGGQTCGVKPGVEHSKGCHGKQVMWVCTLGHDEIGIRSRTVLIGRTEHRTREGARHVMDAVRARLSQASVDGGGGRVRETSVVVSALTWFVCIGMCIPMACR